MPCSRRTADEVDLFDLEAYDYELPASSIAQRPLFRRDHARLLVLGRTGAPGHFRVRDLPRLLRPGDLLVLNDTRVLPARLRARNVRGARVELLFVRTAGDGTWECLARPLRRARVGEELLLGGKDRLRVERVEGGRVFLRCELDVRDVLERYGEVPLPPYIRRSAEPDDRERYQTVFARAPGSVAAPTAGLHFTEELFRKLALAGVRTAFLTLHVGPGTFLPIRERDIRRHRLEPEWVSVPEEVARAVDEAKRRGRRVVAVGTTTCRALESRAKPDGTVVAGEGWAERYLVPGERFFVVDALFTNFHLPRSSLLALVCAFAGRERVLAAYREALARGYRFYSYGDAMLVL
ncbi:MAG: S-adenosylmethionine:tRNA ribosyltransferase-isomerase [Candidatus Binatia bacterium]|nr:MAG: S-adenosylmethionine:tRNA ribosyltransferase-isomerase [Candidatus Binatia bacterium]